MQDPCERAREVGEESIADGGDSLFAQSTRRYKARGGTPLRKRASVFTWPGHVDAFPFTVQYLRVS